MRLAAFVLPLLAVAVPAHAAPDAPYYGPMKPWHGIAIAFKYGYRDHVDADGSRSVEVALRSGEAIDMAVYRAADLARELGYPFVQFLGGEDSPSPGHHSATVWFQLSREPIAPTRCRSRKRDTCYTADVAEVLRVLGGPGGSQPGVALVDHHDEYGREVRMGGYGAGDVTKTPVRVALPVPARVAPVPPVRSVRPSAPALSEAERYRALLEAAQPM